MRSNPESVPTPSPYSRKPRLGRAGYRARNIVERVIGWLKRFRRVAARAEKLAVRYAGMITLALIARAANLLSATASTAP